MIRPTHSAPSARDLPLGSRSRRKLAALVRPIRSPLALPSAGPRALAAAALLTVAFACERLPNEPPASPPGAIRGITFADWTATGYVAPAAETSLARLAATGADAVTLLVTWYQTTPRASTFTTEDPRTPRAAVVNATIARARGLGLAVTLKFHVDLQNGAWRGTIDPADPDPWFVAYTNALAVWARTAEKAGVERMVVGSELAGTLNQEARWRRVIAAVRASFSGELTYAASWDTADRVPFWDALDVVGIDFYAPVARRRNPGRAELLAGWQPWLTRFRRLHRQTGLPVLLTEVGYRSVDGAGLHPYRFDTGGPADPGEQADLYWAALEAVAAEPWVRGLFWWNWLADGSGGPANLDFTPLGKDAEDVLRSTWNPAR